MYISSTKKDLLPFRRPGFADDFLPRLERKQKRWERFLNDQGFIPKALGKVGEGK